MTDILGIHHVTAIASDAQRNVDFYAGLLGLRLVKRTVNFDDPETYHLYYGDQHGSPGTVLTFFVWPGAYRGRQGIGQVAVTSFAALPSSIGFWVERLIRHGVTYEGPTRGGDGTTTLSFKDPDALLIEIVGDRRAAARTGWSHAAAVPAEHALRGFHHVTLWVDDAGPTEHVLVDTLGFRFVGDNDTTRRFAVGHGGPGAIVDVRAVGGFLEGAEGAGTVHHVAWAVESDDVELETRALVIDAGLRPTPVIDRMYFHSVYFNEPGGVLYEIATAHPGFTIDEPLDRLGEQLMLPPHLEPRRAEIEAILPPIHMPAPTSAETFLGYTSRESVD